MSQIDEHVTEMTEFEAEHESTYSEHSDEEEQELGARVPSRKQKGKAAAKKVKKAVAKKSGEERRRKKNYDSFATFIAKLVGPNGKGRKPGFSAKGMEVLESIVKSLATEMTIVANELAKHQGRQTLGAGDFRTALAVRGSLIAREPATVKALTEMGEKAVLKYQSSLGRPAKTAPKKKKATKKASA
ncbi:histone H2B [Acanthamoeba castellanii medusavirus]|uniref:Histone H2B n=2 Tax=Mamonoviridae TaxID=3044469 RepID=A0A3T1CWJ9_9VIRU|nr:histone H2B [Acanthamoeba castellanii medusavirus]BBI30201.1 histone H2B [Acanthamoeba castellanii medusavirus J1]